MFTRPRPRSLLPLILGITLATSACSVELGEAEEVVTLGSSDVVDGEDTTTTVAPASPDQDDPDAPAPVAAPIVDPSPSDDARTGEDDQDAAFCEASADYWVASVAFSHIDRDRPAEVSTLFGLIDSRLDDAIAAAPNDELAAPALLAREHFTVIDEAIADFFYDLDVFEASSAFPELGQSFNTLAEIDSLLNDYLLGPCGYSQGTLDAAAESTASDIVRLVDEVLAADDGDPTDGSNGADYPGDYIEIIDATDRLKVEVPIDWEDVQSEPSGGGAALTIAPDVDAYLTSWDADGLKMTVTDASGPADWRQPMYETNASTDCVLISSEPYSDPLYTGWIDHYENCAGGDVRAVVVGATDEEFSVEILVEVQFDNVDTQNDEDTLIKILDTFKAR
ncbi:MAG: hypothetical protein AAGA65_14520 [Actinomycetota bacterium]